MEANFLLHVGETGASCIQGQVVNCLLYVGETRASCIQGQVVNCLLHVGETGASCIQGQIVTHSFYENIAHIWRYGDTVNNS